MRFLLINPFQIFMIVSGAIIGALESYNYDLLILTGMSFIISIMFYGLSLVIDTTGIDYK